MLRRPRRSQHLPRAFASDPALGKDTEEGIAAILAATKAAGKIAGIHAFSLDDAKQRIAQGFRYLTVMADTRMVRAGATQVLSTLRK